MAENFKEFFNFFMVYFLSFSSFHCKLSSQGLFKEKSRPSLICGTQKAGLHSAIDKDEENINLGKQTDVLNPSLKFSFQIETNN